MLNLLTTWLQNKIRLIEWGVLAVALIGMYYTGYHTRVVLDEAAKSKTQERVIQAIPRIITKTQTITRTINASHDNCVRASLPHDLIEQLR